MAGYPGYHSDITRTEASAAVISATPTTSSEARHGRFLVRASETRPGECVITFNAYGKAKVTYCSNQKLSQDYGFLSKPERSWENLQLNYQIYFVARSNNCGVGWSVPYPVDVVRLCSSHGCAFPATSSSTRLWSRHLRCYLDRNGSISSTQDWSFAVGKCGYR